MIKKVYKVIFCSYNSLFLNLSKAHTVFALQLFTKLYIYFMHFSAYISNFKKMFKKEKPYMGNN